MTTRHVTPEVSLSCCHICHIVPGDQERRRQDKDGSLHCQTQVETRSQGESESYISTVSLFPDGQPFQPIGLVMTPN